MSWLDDLLGKRIQKNGAGVPDRKVMNFIEGSGTSITVADNASTGATDVTIANTLVSVSHAARSVVGRSANTSGVAADIIASVAGTPLMMDPADSTLKFLALPAAGIASNAVTTVKILDANVTTAKIADNNVTNTKIQQYAARSLVGNPSASTGNVQAISTSVDGNVLRMSGTTLGFGTVATAGIADAAVTLAKLDLRNAWTVLGNGINSSGVATVEIAASADNQVLRRQAGTLAFGTILADAIAWEASTGAATAGDLGEYVETILNAGSGVSLTTNVTSNIATVSLTAGDWDVDALLFLGQTPTGFTVGTGAITTTTAGAGTQSDTRVLTPTAPTAAATVSIVIPKKRFSLASTTTVYMTAVATFTGGTCSAYGRLTARRAR